MKNNNEDIDLFFGHFEQLHLSISQSELVYASEVSKSILLCSIIDSVSRVVYPKLGHREKFTYFIDDFSQWKNVDKISLVQLFYFLKEEDDLKYEPLKTYVGGKIQQMTVGKIYEPEFDEYIYNLKYLKVIENEIKKFSYSNLLYKFRNYVIHEFRTPGKGSDFIQKDEIYYHHFGHFGESKSEKTWELVFPVKYLLKLVEDSLDKLKFYCKQNNINPYDNFSFETSWIMKSEVKNK
jgi:hypothetical protein